MLLRICKKVEHLEANSVATRALDKLNLAEVLGENLNCRNGVVVVNRHVEHVRNPPGENLANTPHRIKTQIRRFATKGNHQGVVLQMF